MSRFLGLLDRRPRLALAIMLLASAAAIAGVARLRFDGSVQTLTPPDDPAFRFNAEIERQFGDQEIGVIALLVDDVYQPPVLEALRVLSDRIASIPGVTRALSLATASDPAADIVAPPPLLPRGPVTAATAAEVRTRVKENAIYVPHLVARDGRAAAINTFFAPTLTDADEIRIDHAIEDVIQGYKGPGQLCYTGMSHIRVRATEMMRQDLARFLPLSMIAMMIVLWIAFGSLRATVLPLMSIAVGTAILMGIMGWANEPITLATLVLPSLLIVIGGSYAVHVTWAFIQAAPGERLDTTVRRVGLAILASAMTTAVGFGSLAFHPIPAISGLGIYAVIGNVVVAVGALIGLSLAYRAFPGGRVRADVALATSRTERIDGTIVAVANFAVRHRYLTFAVAGALAIVGAAGVRRIEVSTDLLSAFRRSSDVRRDYDAIAKRLAGPNPVSIVISAPEPGYFRNIVALRRVREFQDFLQSLDGVDSTLSLIDYLDEIDRGVRASPDDVQVDENGEIVPSKPAASFWDAPKEQLPIVLGLVDAARQTFSGVVDPQFQRIRVTARTAVAGSRAANELVHEIETYAATFFPRGIQTRVTGNLVVISSVSDVVLSGQVQSIAIAYAVILALFFMLFLSVRVGVAAMIPNVLPNLIFFGVLGWGAISLNLATSIIGAVALGIGVDNTIHYMTRLNRVVKTTHSHHDALLAAMQIVGRPIVATSIMLTVGFLVMMFSKFALISAFGWLAALTFAASLATTIILLPAVLATVPVVSVWDLVAFRLGPSPNKTIPLFDGLGSLSTRLVVLLGRLREFAPDQHVVRRGEPGNEMYLILTGRAEVRGGQDGPVFARLARGDVIGEMGLLRHTVRTADVVAKSDLEVLVIDEAFLRRLQIRYPRIASRFFVNIARILSDRLETANRRLALVD